MKNIIIPKADDKNIYLSSINSNTKGIIIVYSKENALGYIARDPDCTWNFSFTISIEPDYYAETIEGLLDIIIKRYKDVTLKLLEFNN